ncbi:phospho-2-dehydro-3-deoxyheptonate aldolase [Thiohalorhabdus denitrificans]|uniref:Phospho-2-dehydro-3-deoxyheptonate aldolase n=1 Tax=Thiohalorhabdus denitrificans TaxID=381306 RepID=A0A0P9EST8_9GAMM|nr:3-deoxy-7-phosphoheptulonate synthase [Thiohalorhabdus denitrificans]KPV41736.1 phospho-2-dehydro-3-deoxyheptonate aldolase [Thiohalorhabdus denitrificans]SCY53855.1 3-deoxy-D-arabinoheptulosonate-7-phosphate synthase [Thiohalorhabdus denitrificans]
MTHPTEDLRIASIREVLSPAELHREIPLSEQGAQTVRSTRAAIRDILTGHDDRLLVIVGPCSIHDPEAALDYAARLKEQAARYRDDLLVVMRVYFEKPRTTVGWKGLINDPGLDESFRINDGLRIARRLLRDLAEMGVPSATEFLELVVPQYIDDLVSWGAIGARTAESQVHRQLASGLSSPVGVKNGTGGNLQVAVDAIRSAAHPHHFLSLTKDGHSAIFTTTGNPECHLILRGGREGPNYDAAHVDKAAGLLEEAGLQRRVMVDCSHANSGKDPARQAEVGRDLNARIAAGDHRLIGLMMESHLVAGRQDLTTGAELTYGQSITDACMGWDMTTDLLGELAGGVRARREQAPG